MSESSEDKTKRRTVSALRTYQWSYQHSVFYDDPTESHSLLEDQVQFKQVLRRKCPDQPFLTRIQSLKQGGAPLQAYLTIFTTNEVEGFQSIVDKVFPKKMNARGRRLSDSKLESIITAILEQKPHDLSKIFDKVGTNRWTILNKHQLVPFSVLNDEAEGAVAL